MKLASAFGIGISGYQPHPAMPHPEQCRPGVPPNAEHPIASRPALLAGEYKLFQVRTQPDVGVVTASGLHLEPLDSAARAGAVGGPVRDPVGWVELQGGDKGPRAALPASDRGRIPPDPAGYFCALRVSP